MTEKEIILGDYTLYRIDRFDTIYNVYRNENLVGDVRITTTQRLSWIDSNDTDLITLLLLRYQPSEELEIYQNYG